MIHILLYMTSEHHHHHGNHHQYGHQTHYSSTSKTKISQIEVINQLETTCWVPYSGSIPSISIFILYRIPCLEYYRTTLTNLQNPQTRILKSYLEYCTIYQDSNKISQNKKIREDTNELTKLQILYLSWKLLPFRQRYYLKYWQLEIGKHNSDSYFIYLS